jgi:hypothetical protein
VLGEDSLFFRREGFFDDLVVLVDRFAVFPPRFDCFLVGFVDCFAGARTRALAGGADFVSELDFSTDLS